MQLRRFTADTTPAALAAVRMALGDDAMILSNRKVGSQVEIIATGQLDEMSIVDESEVDEMAAALSQRPPSEPTESHSSRLADVSPTSAQTGSHGRESTRTKSGLSSVEPTTGANTSDEAPFHTDLNAFAPPPMGGTHFDDVVGDTNNLFETLSDDGESLSDHGRKVTPERQPAEHSATRRENREQSEAVSMVSISLELEKQTELLARHFRSLEVNLWGETAPDRSTQLQQLLTLGLGADLAIRLVEACAEDWSADKALRHSLSSLKSSLLIANDKTFSVPGVTIMYGPPGAGKTTALIKLATEHVKRTDEQSIVIICADNRRIGAFEELQAYGKLLGVPTVHAHDTAELASLTAAFKHKQLLLIDHTLPNDERAVALPNSLLHPQNQNEVRHLLALPATTQGATASALIEQNCSDIPMNCVLTQLDTNARLGELLNSVIRHRLPVAYWSDAASVQRPLQRADASVLVATAVAMRRRLEHSVDDQWQHQLIRPASRLLSAGVEAAARSAQSSI